MRWLRGRGMKKERKCFVYVIGRQSGPVKIGISAKPASRATDLQVGCPFKIKLLHAVEFSSRVVAEFHEGMIHSVYSDDRLMGEWFKIDVDQATEAIRTSIETEEALTELRTA